MQQLSAARILATLRQTSDAKAVSARTGTGTKLVTGRVNGCRRNGTGWSNGRPSSNAAVPGQASSLGTRLFCRPRERRTNGRRKIRPATVEHEMTNRDDPDQGPAEPAKLPQGERRHRRAPRRREDE